MLPERFSISSRAIWSFVWLAIVSAGTNAFGSWSSWSGFSFVGPLITLIGLIGIVAVWVAPYKYHIALEHISFGASVVTVLLANGPILATNTYFSTDAAAFSQRATQLLVSGINPYSQKFTAAHLLLNHASDYWTYTLNGSYINQVSYPAGSFLLQAPLQLLGIHHLATDWLDLFAWICAATFFYKISPWYAKWLAPLLLLASAFTFMYTFGGTDALFIPFLMLAAYRWDDFVLHQGARWTRWLGPVSLGIACSIKQTPWFCVPFFIVGIWIEASHHDLAPLKTTVRYASFVAGTFFAINLPFIIWSPSAWLHGALLPMIQPLVPDGQGLVSIATHGLVHVVHPMDLQIAGLLALVSLLLAFVYWYPVAKRIWLFALPLVLFIPSRSLSSYLVDFAPAAFVMVLSTDRVPEAWLSLKNRWLHYGAVALPALLAAVFAGVAFVSAPLSISVLSYGSSSFNQLMNPVVLKITNNTNTAITPHVMSVIGSGHPVGFWTTDSGAKSFNIPAHTSVIITMKPPLHMQPPSYKKSWLMEVLTDKPASLVTSDVYSWPYGRDR